MADNKIVGRMTSLEGDGTTHLFNPTDKNPAKALYRTLVDGPDDESS